MIIAFLTIILVIAVPIGVISGIIKAVKTPSPPPGLSQGELEHWYEGGWKKEQILEEHLRSIEDELKKQGNEDYRNNLIADIERREALKATAQKYLGLSFTDIYHKTMIFTPEGIEVSRTEGPWCRIHQTIPYSDILEVYHQKARWWKAGFFSVITIESGVAHAGIVPSIQQAGDIAADPGTVSYYKGSAKTIRQLLEGIHALKEAYYYD